MMRPHTIAVVVALVLFNTFSWESAQAAKVVEGPKAAQTEAGVVISFTLSEEDDVTVRVFDAKGRPVRRLATGVLGPKAPEPFRKDSLKQVITWDGRDDRGNVVDAKACTVRIDVGMDARFVSAHGNGVAAAVGQSIGGLDVDSKGDLYIVSQHDNRFYGIAVLHRDGTYARTVVPVDPRVPADLVPLQDALAHPYAYPGTRTHAFWRTDTYGRRIPRLINMAGYVKGTTHFGLFFYGRRGLSLVDDDLMVVYGQWYVNSKGLIPQGSTENWTPKGWGHSTANCIDREGNAYVVVPEGSAWASKPGHAVAKFAKFCREERPDFLYAGKKRLDQPTHLLGEPHQPGKDDAHFNGITAIAVDRESDLYVVDDGREALRIFRKDGFPLGEVGKLTVGEEEHPFRARDLTVCQDGTIYVLMPEAARTTLVKLKSWRDPKALWSRAFHRVSRCIAVDENAKPRTVWVANGAGAYTLSRLVDEGDALGEVTTVGGTPTDSLRTPGSTAVDGKGNAYVYDYAAGDVVRITPTGEITRVVSVGRSRPTSSLTVDAERGFLYVCATDYSNRPSMSRFTLDGEPAPFAGGKNEVKLRGSMTRGLAVGPGGDIYANGETGLRLSQLKELGKAPGPFYVVRNQGDWGYAWAHVDIYDPDGNLKKTNHVIPICTGAIAVDSEGAVYTADTDICHAWSYLESSAAIGHTVKYGPLGGGREGPECELSKYSQGVVNRIKESTPAFAKDLPMPKGMEWDKPIGNPRFPAGCGCATSYLNVDDCDRVYVPDSLFFNVVVLDRAGNEITRIGTYGNRDCAGPKSTIPEPEIAFSSITGVTARDDRVWVSDIGANRVLQLRIEYSDTQSTPIR